MNNETSTLTQMKHDSISLYKRYSGAELNTIEGRMYMRRLTMRVLSEMRLEEAIREDGNTL